jgi:hypothetical protein
MMRFPIVSKPGLLRFCLSPSSIYREEEDGRGEEIRRERDEVRPKRSIRVSGLIVATVTRERADSHIEIEIGERNKYHYGFLGFFRAHKK